MTIINPITSKIPSRIGAKIINKLLRLLDKPINKLLTNHYTKKYQPSSSALSVSLWSEKKIYLPRRRRVHRENTDTMKREIIYTPLSSLRHPKKLLREMWQDLLASRELAWRLMVRDINSQYRQSLLGITWAFLPPIVMAAGFTLANQANVIQVGKTDIPYPAYVTFSTALWQTFVEALNAPLQAVTQARPILAKVNFPREALIIAKLGETLFNFAIKILLIIALFIWFQIPVTWTIILAPVAIIHLILLGTLIGILLAPLGLLYQDISRGLTLITGFWLFLTPVIYPVPKTGIFAALVNFNPVTPLLVTARELATTGNLSQSTAFWIVSIITFIGLILTWIAFRLAMPFVVERVG